jgi:hypothetical protein
MISQEKDPADPVILSIRFIEALCWTALYANDMVTALLNREELADHVRMLILKLDELHKYAPATPGEIWPDSLEWVALALENFSPERVELNGLRDHLKLWPKKQISDND